MLMDNLVYNCTNALPQPSNPTCPTDYGEKVIMVAFMKEGGTFTVATDYATASEFQTAITAGEVTLIKGIGNGHRIKKSSTTLSGDDTITGSEEEYDKVYSIEGRIRIFDEDTKDACTILDKYSQLRCWFFTDRNYCYGGSTGYKGAPSFDDVIHEGKGQPPYIPFHFDYTSIGYDNAHYDADYSTLANP